MQEEAQLKHYFTTETVAPHLEVYRTIFAYYSTDAATFLPKTFTNDASQPQHSTVGLAAAAVVIAIMFSAYMTLTSREESYAAI